jgi:hypothetical protein
MIRKMVIDPVLLLIAGSAAAIGIVLFAAYKSTERSAESIAIGTTTSSTASTSAIPKDPVPIAIETSPDTSTQSITNSYDSPSPTESSIREAPVDETPTTTQQVPEQVINLAQPTFSAPETTVEAPIFEPVTEQQTPSELQETFVPKPDFIEEAPSPFPEESFTVAPPQTPAPTDVSAVENFSAPNSSAASTPAPVLVISTPKKRQSKSRKISSSSGIPRKKKSTKSRSQSVQLGSPSAAQSDAPESN